MRAAARTLMNLQSWTPHPAAPGTHDFLDIILHAVDQEALHNTAAYRTYLHDETLVMYCPALRNCLTRFLPSSCKPVEQTLQPLRMHIDTEIIIALSCVISLGPRP